MDIRIIHLTLQPIGRSMDKSRDVVLTVSRVEQSRIGFKNFLRILRERRILRTAFELLETMLNEPVVNYQCFV
jgi:hypothetical protein